MSSLSTSKAPSKQLLRFLRAQSRAVETKEIRCLTSRAGRRTISSSCRRQVGPRSYIDDLFSRNREKCKALPAPRLPARYSSSDSSPEPQHRPSFWQRLFRHNSTHARDHKDKRLPDVAGSPSGYSYEDSSAQLFNLSRALSRSPSGSDQKLRCTEFDQSGSVTIVAGEFKKSELIAKYGLLPRDLRKIESSVLPHILVRPTAILINLLHLRVLIQSDRVLVFDAYGSTDSYTQSLFMYDLEGKLRQKQSSSDIATEQKSGNTTYLPYEFRALEAVLISVTSGLEAEFALVRDPVTHILRALEEDIDREKLRHLLIHSKKLGTFEQKARLVRDALDELLEADDDLAAMYLTERKKEGKPRQEDDHQEVEMLLESYHKICDEVVEISGNLISNIRNTEEVVKAILDANRNQLMLFEIKVSVATLGLAAGTLIAGLYGMNLENFIEESNYGFGTVTSVCFILSAWVAAAGIRRLRKVQKVRMFQEGPDMWSNNRNDLRDMAMRKRGSWHNEALEAQMHQIRQRSIQSKIMMGAQPGPVLYPGMQGLGLAKAERGLPGEFESTNSDSDDFGERPKKAQFRGDVVSIDRGKK